VCVYIYIYIYIYISIMKPTKRGREKRNNGYIMEGVNLFKVYIHMYGIINDNSPCIINVC
jgi:hypothetical protein